MFKQFSVWVTDEEGKPYYEKQFDSRFEALDCVRNLLKEARPLNHRVWCRDIKTGKIVK